jgi:hypothetical protein
MINDFLGSCKKILIETVNKLKSSDRRIALAKIADKYGYGGKSLVAKEFNAGRDTITKGMLELKENKPIQDAHDKKGRKNILYKLPNLKNDIQEIAESQSQIDPKFQSERLYIKLTVKAIRGELIDSKGYADENLPSNQTINNIVNDLGFKLKKIQKTKPLKKIEETDLIFDNLKKVHETIKHTDRVLRLSIDAKDKVKIGYFSRGGKNRCDQKAFDHDFGDKYITPFGIINYNNNTVDISMIESKLTADCIVDRLEEYYYKNDFKDSIDVMVINSDNGPEGNSKRTQFIKRIVEFAAKIDKKIILAYYPPYHSKYNPIERVWGRLEQWWNGDLLDSIETIVKFAESVTWKGFHPVVSVVDKVYETKKKIKGKTLKIYESALNRKRGIEKWFIILKPEKCKRALLEVNNL